ncbi:hypothetical protein PHLGIDRAFT_183088 [Phlebiopsis gigantea 11061_1 CR5-6]|uniref:Uncharacterized protein n=1 Tax=Phlebiopsis gigantea (strain 11061_1 CR5-6) TaxID=745531 RepID=A0A0C3NIE9_PHLG1|nr:hypothetical protein PHLGIDRAFT_183088 [Phlebiopsis gigantea 11061_1 CR5-6]
MPSVNGVYISVISEDDILDEYAIENLDDRTVGCFVPGAPDKTFQILLTNTLNLQGVSVAIIVDNNPIGRYYLAPGQRLLPGLYATDSTLRPLKFRTLVFEGEIKISCA